MASEYKASGCKKIPSPLLGEGLDEGDFYYLLFTAHLSLNDFIKY